MNYYMHRISHEWEVAYALLDMGYLSIGWRCVSKSNILGAIHKSECEFNEFCKNSIELNGNRSRWNLWHFCNLKKGDIVVVPLFDGEFSIYVVESCVVPISEIEKEVGNFIDRANRQISFVDGEMVTSSGGKVDIGFACSVKTIRRNLSRNLFADAKLTARMKMRQTNGRIDDIADSVITSINAKEPINFYRIVLEQAASDLLEKIHSILNPNNVERLIELYFKKIGASNTYITAKNEPGKCDGADADVIAEFENLRTVYYVQVKKHVGTTGDWAVTQIEQYFNQKGCMDSSYTYIPWVVSTAEDFSKEAIEKARYISEESGVNVRLINGMELSRMILDSGLSNLVDL